MLSGTLISTSLLAGVSLFSAAGDLTVFASSLVADIEALSELFLTSLDVVDSPFVVVSLLCAAVCSSATTIFSYIAIASLASVSSLALFKASIVDSSLVFAVLYATSVFKKSLYTYPVKSSST